jgi:hemolysin activation/secretion protein
MKIKLIDYKTRGYDMLRFFCCLCLLFCCVLEANERIYKIDDFHFEYSQYNEELPPLNGLENFVSPFINYGEISASEIRNISEKIVTYFYNQGLGGIAVKVSPKDIDNKGRDLRYKKRGTLNLIISIAPITQVNTLAFAENITSTDNIDLDKHSKIKNASPVSQNALLRPDDINDYIYRLNRHSGRLVQARLRPGDSENTLDLEYLIAENKPWLVHLSAMNVGTKETAYWHETLGYLDNQLTSADDTLSLAYSTAGFKEVHSVTGSYERPFSPGSFNKGKISFLVSDYKATTLGIDNKLESREISTNAEFSHTIYQHKSFFIDLVSALQFRNIAIQNVTANKKSTNFLLPSFGIRFEEKQNFLKFSGGMYFSKNLATVAGTDQDALKEFGRGNVADNWHVIKYDGQIAKTFLSYHEAIISLRGQYGFDYRIIPQDRFVMGGIYTVRGYPHSITSGDSGIAMQSMYKFNLPKILYTNLSGHLFIDYGRTINNKLVSSETNHSLLSTGLGIDMNIKNHFNLKIDYGIPLEDFLSPTNSNDDVKAGKGCLHVTGTVMY